MNKENTSAENWKQKACSSTIKLMLWTFAWVLTVALASFGPKFLWSGNKLITILSLLINVGFGIGMVFANKAHIDSMDELQQKIQLEAMGITQGATLVGGIAYTIMDSSNLISGDAEIGLLVGFMGICYMVTVVINRFRYL